MKLTLIVEEIKPGLERWFNDNAPRINEDFKREGIFTKLYKQMPKIVRSKIPFDIILSNRDKLVILNSYKIEQISEKRYRIIMDFNQETLDSFDVILLAVRSMPGWMRKQIENALLKQEGSSLETITRDGLVKKVIHAIETGDSGKREALVISKVIE